MIEIKIDTLITIINDTINHTAIIEITKSNNYDDYWINLCDCKLISDLIWPVTVLIIILLFYKKIRNLLNNIGTRAKKIKVGAIELELEELNRKTEVIEKTITEKELRFAGIGSIKHPYEFDYEIINNLPTEILKISIEIERTLKSIYEMAYKTREKRPLAVSVLIETFREKGIIDLEFSALLKQFWNFRNNIVHTINYSVTDKELLAFTDIGIRVLRILKVLQNNINDGTLMIEFNE